ncbi:MAG: hypothetical protein OHK0048_08050 [Rhodoferax sp.]
MRVNARFEGVAEQPLEYLVKTTGRSVSEVLRDSVAHDYQHVRGSQPTGLKHLGPLIGTGDSGRNGLSVRYKELLTESWSRKYGLAPLPVAQAAGQRTGDAASAEPMESAARQAPMPAAESPQGHAT